MAAISSPSATLGAHYLPVRQAWLDRRKEPTLDVNLPIVNPHHHIWDREGWRYLLDDLLGDTNNGHNIVATVFVEARSMRRATGPVELRPVGEVEFANGVAAMSGSAIYGKTRVCAGIVGHAHATSSTSQPHRAEPEDPGKTYLASETSRACLRRLSGGVQLRQRLDATKPSLPPQRWYAKDRIPPQMLE